MKLVTWRHLFLALAVGTLTYFACKSWWPEPKPWASVAVHWLGGRSYVMEFSPDVSLFAVTVEDELNRTRVIRASDGQTLVLTPRSCVFSPKGDLFALYDTESVELFDSRDGKPVPGTHQKTANRLVSLCFDAAGRMHAVMIDETGTIAQCLEPNSEPKRIEGILGMERRQSKPVIIVRKGSDYRIWDFTTGQVVAQLTAFPGLGLDSISNDAQIALEGAGFGPAKLHNLRTGTVRSLPFGIYKACLSPDGAQAVGQIYIDRPDPTIEPAWFQRLKDILGIKAAAESQRSGITLFDTDTGAELAYFDRGNQGFFSPDGKTLAVHDRDGKIQMWRLPWRSAVPYWIAISIGAGLCLFVLLRRAQRRRERAKASVTMPSISA